MNIKETVKEITSKQKVDKIFYVACGGSIAAFYPCKFLIEKEAKELSVGYYTSNEFIHALPASLTSNSVVIGCSHQGSTPETVKALEIAKKQGATVIAFSYNPEGPLFENADYTLSYSWGDSPVWSKKKECEGLKLTMEFLYQQEGWGKYDKAMEGFERYDNVAMNAREYCMDAARSFAEANKVEKVIYTVGSGATWGSAYMECICILMEMQWINSNCIHSGEFFHGPLEITDTETPFLVMVSEGSTRPLDERVIKFLKKYGRKVYTIDAKDLGVNVIDNDVVEYFVPLLMNAVVDVYNHELEIARKHPLSTRRYMWKVEY